MCRLVLAGVFLSAGLAKLADLPGSRAAVADFGVPARFADAAGTALPLLELAIAVALIPVSLARFGALAAIVLLVAFIAAIANAVVHGRAPECHCFGQVHSEPAGPRTLVRNAALLAVAGFIALAGWNGGGVSATHWVTRIPAPWLVTIAAGIVIVAIGGFLVWFVLAVLEQNGRIIGRLDALEGRLASIGEGLGLEFELDQLDTSGGSGIGAGLSDRGLPVGSVAPAFELDTPSGERVSLADLLLDRRLVLVFSDAGCGPCEALMPRIGEWQSAHASSLRFAVLATGELERNREKASAYGIELTLIDVERRVAEAYEAHGTPMAVVIGDDGRILSPLVGGVEGIVELVAQASAPVRLDVVHAGSAGGAGNGRAHRDPVPEPDRSRVGSPAPELSLVDLTGQRVALRDLYGERTLAIFWNPGCGFCERMLADLRAFEENPPPGAPSLVVISSGDREQTRAQAFRSRVLFDPESTAAQAFDAHGTPMGVLIEDGAIASHVAAGAQAVFELAHAH